MAYDVRVRVPRIAPDGSVERDGNGNRIYFNATRRCYTLAEANAQLISLSNQRDVGSGDNIHNQRFVNDLIDYYRREYVRPAVIHNGRRVIGYRSNLNTWNHILDICADYFDGVLLDDVTYEDLRRFSNHLMQTPNIRGRLPAVSTVNGYLSLLRRVFNVGIQLDWLDVNPFKRGQSLIHRSNEVKRNRMLTFEEERLLFDAIEPHFIETTYIRDGRKITQRKFVDRSYLKPLLICALDTAMRVGEIFNLEYQQIDIDARVIFLRGSSAEKTKTGTEGVVPMTERLAETFSAIIQVRPFWKTTDKLIRRFHYKRAFRSACVEAGIPDLQVRDLRATAATRMVLAGAAESQVMKITRHKTMRIFIDHYTNVDVANAQLVGRNLDVFLADQTSKDEVRDDNPNAPKIKRS